MTDWGHLYAPRVDRTMWRKGARYKRPCLGRGTQSLVSGHTAELRTAAGNVTPSAAIWRTIPRHSMTCVIVEAGEYPDVIAASIRRRPANKNKLLRRHGISIAIYSARFRRRQWTQAGTYSSHYVPLHPPSKRPTVRQCERSRVPRTGH